ncbi:LppP/LprE family lipoprotein [Nocardia sp. NPDC051030]|uniref:LppP/LprE family lipoprotein n=1 Tax=Nocardia sp. NPDC051030 TaxID=3155162 RepID=UPI00342ACF70
MRAKSAMLVSLVAGTAIAVAGCGTTSGTAAPADAVAQQRPAAPEGSGHGLCFDLNSGLAQSGLARLGAAPIGTWSIGLASDDPISSGCDGVLSWMTVDTDTNHPYTHVLFFTNGTYLGTATYEPYMYTQVTGKTRNTVSVKYSWIKDSDPLCCPSGGPSVVTYTLNGTTVQANGQFPPHN